MADTACNYTGPLIGGGSVRGRGTYPFVLLPRQMDQPWTGVSVTMTYLIFISYLLSARGGVGSARLSTVHSDTHTRGCGERTRRASERFSILATVAEV